MFLASCSKLFIGAGVLGLGGTSKTGTKGSQPILKD
jgi:hypothetical protein